MINICVNIYVMISIQIFIDELDGVTLNINYIVYTYPTSNYVNDGRMNLISKWVHIGLDQIEFTYLN